MTKTPVLTAYALLPLPLRYMCMTLSQGYDTSQGHGQNLFGIIIQTQR